MTAGSTDSLWRQARYARLTGRGRAHGDFVRCHAEVQGHS